MPPKPRHDGHETPTWLQAQRSAPMALDGTREVPSSRREGSRSAARVYVQRRSPEQRPSPVQWRSPARQQERQHSSERRSPARPRQRQRSPEQRSAARQRSPARRVALGAVQAAAFEHYDEQMPHPARMSPTRRHPHSIQASGRRLGSGSGPRWRSMADEEWKQTCDDARQAGIPVPKGVPETPANQCRLKRAIQLLSTRDQLDELNRSDWEVECYRDDDPLEEAMDRCGLSDEDRLLLWYENRVLSCVLAGLTRCGVNTVRRHDGVQSCALLKALRETDLLEHGIVVKSLREEYEIRRALDQKRKRQEMMEQAMAKVVARRSSPRTALREAAEVGEALDTARQSVQDQERELCEAKRRTSKARGERLRARDARDEEFHAVQRFIVEGAKQFAYSAELNRGQLSPSALDILYRAVTSFAQLLALDLPSMRLMGLGTLDRWLLDTIRKDAAQSEAAHVLQSDPRRRIEQLEEQLREKTAQVNLLVAEKSGSIRGAVAPAPQLQHAGSSSVDRRLQHPRDSWDSTPLELDDVDLRASTVSMRPDSPQGYTGTRTSSNPERRASPWSTRSPTPRVDPQNSGSTAGRGDGPTSLDTDDGQVVVGEHLTETSPGPTEHKEQVHGVSKQTDTDQRKKKKKKNKKNKNKNKSKNPSEDSTDRGPRATPKSARSPTPGVDTQKLGSTAGRGTKPQEREPQNEPDPEPSLPFESVQSTDTDQRKKKKKNKSKSKNPEDWADRGPGATPMDYVSAELDYVSAPGVDPQNSGSTMEEPEPQGTYPKEPEPQNEQTDQEVQITCVDWKEVTKSGSVAEHVRYQIIVKRGAQTKDIWRRWSACQNLDADCAYKLTTRGSKRVQPRYQLKFPSKSWRTKDKTKIDTRRSELNTYFEDFTKWINSVMKNSNYKMDLITGEGDDAEGADPKRVIQDFFDDTQEDQQNLMATVYGSGKVRSYVNSEQLGAIPEDPS